ncbi:transposase [Streptomyces sp. NRRL WC-3744]|uniref:transposase n=1 Tax=Streptomyces sp. NRRL WC-3744 TaxID=1463935 RepID=UPI0009986F27
MGVQRALPADRQVRPRTPSGHRGGSRGWSGGEDGWQWREMPGEFGAWPTVHNRFQQWRDADVLEASWRG